MRLGKVYAHGKHAIEQVTKYAPHTILKVFQDAKGADIAQISLFKLLHPYEDFIASLEVTPKTALVLLAGIEDPHNIGAIIRTAAAFGVAGILMPTVGQAPVSDTVLKVSSGMAFRIPLVTIEGYQQALSDLRKRGFKIVALDQTAKTNLSDTSFDAPVVFVFGNEGEGIPGAVKPLLDMSLKIPMDDRAESLNVAAAAAVTLYAWSISK